MNTLYVVGNWKEYPETNKDAKKLAVSLGKMKLPKGVVSIVCPPAPFLFSVGQEIKKGKHTLGSQDASPFIVGAYTGEVSPKQLASLGVRYVLVGHSERRALGESDGLVLEKIKAVLFSGGTPILCVGEHDRENSVASHEEVRRELSILADLSKKDIEKILIAYEPIWAIGAKAKNPASPEDAREMRIYIQKVLADMLTEKVMRTIPILYGGSVSGKNANDYITVAGMQGLLVGRASLDAKAYTEIVMSLGKK